MPRGQNQWWTGVPIENTLRAGALWFPVKLAPLLRQSYRPNPAGQELLHHALPDGAGFGPADFKCDNFGVHVGEGSGDSSLLCNRRKRDLHHF